MGLKVASETRENMPWHILAARERKTKNCEINILARECHSALEICTRPRCRQCYQTDRPLLTGSQS